MRQIKRDRKGLSSETGVDKGIRVKCNMNHGGKYNVKCGVSTSTVQTRAK